MSYTRRSLPKFLRSPMAISRTCDLELSIVVPCYNEDLGLHELVRRCRDSAATAIGNRYELILVDDGSTDGTWETMVCLTAHENVVAIKLSRNYGQEVALTAGLAAVRGRAVLIIDADLQDPPELLAQMLQRMKETSSDVVYGKRNSRAGESWFKTWTARSFYRLLESSTDVSIPVDTGNFRLMSRRIADIIAQMPERDRFIRGMVASIGFKQVAFTYDQQERYAGSTKYPLAKLVRLAADAILGYSMVLLRFSSIAAFGVLVAFVGVAAYSLYAWIYLAVAPGWRTSLMLSIIIVAFLQLVALSIIGEYVGRIYLSTKNRPLFIVDSIAGGRNE